MATGAATIAHESVHPITAGQSQNQPVREPWPHWIWHEDSGIYRDVALESGIEV